MNIKSIFLVFVSVFILNSCHKEIKSEKGGIDLITNVYFDASRGLDKMQSFHISKMSYSENQIIELVPNHTFPEMNQNAYLVRDSFCYPLDAENGNIILSDILEKQKPALVWNKKDGAIFSKEMIPNYNNRRKLSDTVLFKKNTDASKSIRLGTIPVSTSIRQTRFCRIPSTDTPKRIMAEDWSASIPTIKRPTSL